MSKCGFSSVLVMPVASLDVDAKSRLSFLSMRSSVKLNAGSCCTAGMEGEIGIMKQRERCAFFFWAGS